MKRISFKIHSVVQRTSFILAEPSERIEILLDKATTAEQGQQTEVLPERVAFDIEPETERISLVIKAKIERMTVVATNAASRITATVAESKATRVSFGINKTVSRISAPISRTLRRLSANIDASIDRVVGEISHWIDVAGVLFRHKESVVSKMFIDFYHNVLLPSVREATITKMMVSFYISIFMASVKEKTSTNMLVNFYQSTLFTSIKETSAGKMLVGLYQDILMKSDKDIAASKMYAILHNEVLLKSIDVVQTFCAFVGTMVFGFFHKDATATFCAMSYDVATLLESADIQRHSMTLSTAYDTVFQSVDIALNEARIRYTHPAYLKDYTFAIGDPDIKLSDWCYMELDYS